MFLKVWKKCSKTLGNHWRKEIISFRNAALAKISFFTCANLLIPKVGVHAHCLNYSLDIVLLVLEKSNEIYYPSHRNFSQKSSEYWKQPKVDVGESAFIKTLVSEILECEKYPTKINLISSDFWHDKMFNLEIEIWTSELFLHKIR